ncbi:Glycosyltransferase involved in cell wall bisynthesis [Verrucomicrobium sp. GAS474]|uniref:glycosyltransferase n=1 Tax=Verrucomicrobium sp. GAS474 TaxID=1882831 RepID=UPI00087B3C4E|nr:glycosyltransferase [Verrucomicrobium sp. GAS474]SDT86156.1 Glycosyltransferase involved in cell wall bisynthesis [Verrucomicrobium sp. GAS474]
MPRTRLNIAFVNTCYRLGGAETVTAQLRRGMEERGHRTRLFVGLQKTYPLGDGVRPLYPRALSYLRNSRLGARVEALAPVLPWSDRAFRRLASSDFDVVHLHSFHGEYATLESLAWLARRKPVCWTIHSHWPVTGGCAHPLGCERYQDACGECPHLDQWPMNGVDITAEQLAAKRRWLSDAPIHAVAVSDHSLKLIGRSPVSARWAVTRIHNGIGMDWAQGGDRRRDAAFRASLGLSVDPAVRTILMVNRDYRNRDKGFPEMAEALRSIDPRGIQVVLVGGAAAWARGELPPGLDCVEVGYAVGERLQDFYRAADYFLFASAGENFPCVILEAMAAGCAIVATPTQGVTEQIVPGVNGWLAGEITGKALGLALQKALDGGDDLRESISRAGREWAVTHFSEETMVDRYESLYGALAGGGVGTAGVVGT